MFFWGLPSYSFCGNGWQNGRAPNFAKGTTASWVPRQIDTSLSGVNLCHSVMSMISIV